MGFFFDLVLPCWLWGRSTPHKFAHLAIKPLSLPPTEITEITGITGITRVTGITKIA